MKLMEDILKEASGKAVRLKAERESRPDKSFPEDHRIATEIAAHQYELGKLEKDLREQNQRSLKLIESNKKSISEIHLIYGALQAEMDIATHRPSKVRKPLKS